MIYAIPPRVTRAIICRCPDGTQICILWAMFLLKMKYKNKFGEIMFICSSKEYEQMKS